MFRTVSAIAKVVETPYAKHTNGFTTIGGLLADAVETVTFVDIEDYNFGDEFCFIVFIVCFFLTFFSISSIIIFRDDK